MIRCKLHQPYKSDIKQLSNIGIARDIKYLSNWKTQEMVFTKSISLSLSKKKIYIYTYIYIYILYPLFQYISIFNHFLQIFWTSQITLKDSPDDPWQPEVVHLVQSSTQKQSWSRWGWLHLGDAGWICNTKWVFPKMVGFPPNHPFVHGVFHDFHHPFWGTPILVTPQMFPHKALRSNNFCYSLSQWRVRNVSY